jgi:hypothetical protein
MYYIIHNPHDKESRQFIEQYGAGNQIINFYEEQNPQTIMFKSLNIGISDFPSVVDINRKLVSTRPSTFENACLEIEGLGTSMALRTRKDQVNHKTRMLIQNGITFSGVEISLRLENQSTLNSLYLQRANLTYPLQIKGFTDLITLQNQAELESLHNQATEAVLNILNSGYIVKQELEEMSYQELLSFVDLR